ncbi:MAG: hypothetical protein HW416_2894 [Chloroflexi bacterium]|nr:hypothetical protein [Chloroflexota bacterium]
MMASMGFLPSNPIRSLSSSLLTGALLAALFVPHLGGCVSQPNGSRGTIQLTPKEWEEFETNLNDIPFYIVSIERARALALIRAGLETRPSGVEWGELAVTLCSIDGEQRRRLEGDQRTSAYRETLECLEPFNIVALARSQQSPLDSDAKASVQSLQEASAEAAVEAGDTALAKLLATALLEQNSDLASWNYANIIHNGNQVLGRVALREGNATEARRYLLRAGNTPGSPTLNSFGPQMFLARELLERGERAVVLEYLDLVRRFWNESRLAELDQWKREIAEGKIPASENWR